MSASSSAAAKSSSCVYVRDDEHGWLPATVVGQSDDGGTATVAVATRAAPTEQSEGATTPGDDGAAEAPLPADSDPSSSTVTKREITVKLSDYPSNVLPLQNVDENGNLIQTVDMCDLPSLHEPAILYNLKARYESDMPYTRTGDIVIAVNPFRWIEELYSDETREMYSDKLVWNAGKDGGAEAKSSLDPHVYEASCLAYRGLAAHGKDQSILVSGESGAGKTESVKIVMTHLASVPGGSSAENLHGGGAAATDDSSSSRHQSNTVVKRVLDSNPLLEAFGNAKTVRNDNSSRFGKYTQLQFDAEDPNAAAMAGRPVPSCVLAGSYCETYLLEKSRVVSHEQAERTYHVFYQLLAAPEEVKVDVWRGLAGKGNDSFKYVGQTDTVVIEGRSDAENWRRTVDALALVGVGGEKLKTLLRAVCTVLQLGNLVFAPDPNNDEASVVASGEELDMLSDVMGIPASDLAASLTTRTVTAGKEVYSVPLRESEAKDGCDAFAKEIYHQIFDWLVRAINDATSAEFNYDGAGDVEQFGIIGLLDIFGFESFQVNRFEQLCINYTNEKLQQKYIVDVFRSVKDEYESEGVGIVDVTIDDNADVLNLLEGRIGVMAVLNEECVRPQGDDKGFVSKVKGLNKESEYLIQKKLHRECEFAIEHYAGAVQYDATNFVQKNNDSLPMDLLHCAGKSTNDIISTELLAVADAAESAKSKGGGRGKASSVTILSKFRSQLNSLMTNIGKTRTRYIRCIKPNPDKQPGVMNLKSSVEQLRCAGIVAAVTVSRVAFPNRLRHDTAINRFQFLLEEEERPSPAVSDWEEKKEMESDEGEEVERLFTTLLKPMEVVADGVPTKAFVCGKTRVYFKMGALEFLESKRLVALGNVATIIQRYARGFVALHRFSTVKDATVVAQTVTRRTLARSSYLSKKGACIALSCWVRCFMANAKLIMLRKDKACCLVQARWRLVQARSMLLMCRAASVVMQSMVRGALQRPVYRTMLAESIEEAKVNSKVQALQRRLAEAEMKWFQAEKHRADAEQKVVEISAGAPQPATAAKVQIQEEEKKAENMSSLQHALFDESQQMLDYLKSEVFNLKAKNYLLRSDLDELKATNHQLAEHNATVTASFEALRQHANNMSRENMRLMVQEKKHKETMKSLRKEINMNNYSYLSDVSKLKEDQRKQDAAHNAEIAKLKRELSEANRRKPSSVEISPKSDKQPSSGRTSPSSLQSSQVFRRTTSVDSLDRWGHDGFWANTSSDAGSVRREKFTMGKRQNSFDRHARRDKKKSSRRALPKQYKGKQSLRRGSNKPVQSTKRPPTKKKVQSSLATAVVSSTEPKKMETSKSSLNSSLGRALSGSKTNISSLAKARESSGSSTKSLTKQ